MPTKRRLTLRMRIPPYRSPRNEWRRAIHKELTEIADTKGIQYKPTEKLELSIVLYLPEEAIGWHDVDNRLKDIMDALQGRAGGSKKDHHLHPVIPNDHQIHKVNIEKRTPPPQSHGLGHLVIRKHKEKKTSN